MGTKLSELLNRVHHSDCVAFMRTLPDNCIDSIVTDPPYELGFMGKSWDNTGIANSIEMRGECLRILKPGGHLLSFSGTRTYHRMACAIEDAGFEVRDMIEWVYGSGFPKSLNIGKKIDQIQGNEREDLGVTIYPDGSKGRQTAKHFGGTDLGGKSVNTKGTSPREGRGTALKPAHEPICMARKPLGEKTVALNVLKWGTGGINIDGSRVSTEDKMSYSSSEKQGVTQFGTIEQSPLGRFPANLLHDNSEEVRECFPESKSTGGESKKYGDGESFGSVKGVYHHFGDSGNASRFFKDISYSSIYGDFVFTFYKTQTLCGQLLIKKRKDITFDGVINEVERFLQDVELLIYGNNITEKYLNDTVYTIKTLIAKMTELKTLSVLPNWLIMKFTERSEQTIKSLSELNIENVKNVKSIEMLIYFIKEQLESINDIVNVVVQNNLESTEEKENNSRFFKSILYYPKASKAERDKGCEDFEIKRPDTRTSTGMGSFEQKGVLPGRNFHPTVKSLKLMEYLIKMVTREGGIVFDPFTGSGTTLVAAKKNGFQYLGTEMTDEYIPIIEARLNATEPEEEEIIDKGWFG